MSFARSESRRAFGCVGMGMGADSGAQALDSGARVWVTQAPCGLGRVGVGMNSTRVLVQVRARGCAGGCRFGHAGVSVHGCGC